MDREQELLKERSKIRWRVNGLVGIGIGIWRKLKRGGIINRQIRGGCYLSDTDQNYSVCSISTRLDKILVTRPAFIFCF